MFIIGSLLLILAIIAFVVAKRTKFYTETSSGRYGEAATKELDTGPNRLAKVTGVVLAGLGALALASTMIYFQGAGEAKVQVDMTGNVIDHTTSTGAHFKAPWVKTVTYDIRNNVISYIGDGATNYSGGSATGNQITVQDKDGTTADIDLTVNYSIDPAAVEQIYVDYGTQENFVNSLITNTIRSVSRDVPAKYSAIQFLNNRAQAALDISDSLESRWEGDGVLVNNVDLQEIRYDDSVRDRFSEAQNARTEIQKAQAQLETARVNAEKAAAEAQGRADSARIEAQGQADANRLLSESLTPEVLQQRYLDALGSGTVFVVPEGSTPLITTNQAPQ